MAISVLRATKKTIGQQVHKLNKLYPQFKYSRSIWIGEVKPTQYSIVYRIKIEYRVGFNPSVWVLSPVIDPTAPHLFKPENNLCLFDNRDGRKEWTSDDFICDTIVPWTFEWLKLYELWKVTGIWYGPEAPHNPNLINKS